MRISFLQILTVFAAVWFSAPPARAAATLQIEPVRLELPPSSRRSTKILVKNHGNAEVNLQARVYLWTQGKDGKDILEPTFDFVLTPPIMRLSGGESQTIRLRMRADSDAREEKTFRLLLEELPPSDRQPGIFMRMQYLLPIFVGGQDPGADPVDVWLERTEEFCAVRVRNRRSRHVNIQSLRAVGEGRSIHVTAPLYVLAGAELELPCPAELRGIPLTVEIQLDSDAGFFTSTGSHSSAVAP